MSRTTLAVWKFASCDGCQLTLLDCEDELLTLAEQVEIANFAEASSAMVKTDIPGGALSAFAKLALRARDQKVSTVSLVPPAINTAHPDLDKIHDMVENAIDRAESHEQ